MTTIPNYADTTTSHEVVGFAIIPNWMTRDPAVTPMMIAVYVTVSGHCGQRGAWQISHQTLADEVGVSTPTIKRTLTALRELGVVDWDTPADPTRGCTYRLTYPLDHQRPTPEVTHDLPPRSPMIYTEEQREEPLEQPPTPADAGEELTLLPANIYSLQPRVTFEDFWAVYPKKKCRADAERAWPKAVKKAPAETILAALRLQLPSMAMHKRPDGDFRPNGATWLNGERWNDEVESPEEHSPWETVEDSHAYYQRVVASNGTPATPEERAQILAELAQDLGINHYAKRGSA